MFLVALKYPLPIRLPNSLVISIFVLCRHQWHLIKPPLACCYNFDLLTTFKKKYLSRLRSRIITNVMLFIIQEIVIPFCSPHLEVIKVIIEFEVVDDDSRVPSRHQWFIFTTLDELIRVFFLYYPKCNNEEMTEQQTSKTSDIWLKQ